MTTPGERHHLCDLTAAEPGNRATHEWRGITPPNGRSWKFAKDKMDEMAAKGRIVFRPAGMPVYKRHLEPRS